MNREYFKIGDSDEESVQLEAHKQIKPVLRDERERKRVSQFRGSNGGPIYYSEEAVKSSGEIIRTEDQDGDSKQQTKMEHGNEHPEELKKMAEMNTDEEGGNTTRKAGKQRASEQQRGIRFWRTGIEPGTPDEEISEFLGQEKSQAIGRRSIETQTNRNESRYERGRKLREERRKQEKTRKTELTVDTNEANSRKGAEKDDIGQTSAHELGRNQIKGAIRMHDFDENTTEEETECIKCLRDKARKDLIKMLDEENENSIINEMEVEEVEEINREATLNYIELMKKLGIQRVFYKPEIDIINRICLEYTAQSALLNSNKKWRTRLSNHSSEIYAQIMMKINVIGSPVHEGDPGPEKPIILTEIILGRFRVRSDGTTEIGIEVPLLAHNGSMNEQRFKHMMIEFFKQRDYYYRNKIDISRHKLEEIA